jgi:hypothetical protein
MQQFLTNLLPGLRDLRAPLAAGYLWLVSLWLLVADRLPEKTEATGALAAMFKLADALGPVSTVIAASFAAYVLGAISETLLEYIINRVRVTIVEQRGGSYAGNPTRGMSYSGYLRLREVVQSQVEHETMRIADMGDFAEFVDRYEMKYDRSIAVEGSLHDTLDRLTDVFADDVRTGLHLIEDRLMGKNPELYGVIDRLDAESEFRMAIAPPLAVLVSILAVELSWLFLVALLGVVILFASGLQRGTKASAKLVDALVNESLEAPALEALRKDVDEVLAGQKTRREGEEARREGGKERDRNAAYSWVDPFLRACNSLQSRLYNLLCLDGLDPLRKQFPRGEYAEETLYLASQYFAHASYVRRFRYEITGLEFRYLIEEVELAFARDDGYWFWNMDAWQIFRQTQRELGKLVTASVVDDKLDTLSFLEFKKELEKFLELNKLENPFQTLEAAIGRLKTVDPDFHEDPDLARRLTAIQTRVLNLRIFLEAEFNRLNGEKRPLSADVGRADSCREAVPTGFSEA